MPAAIAASVPGLADGAIPPGGTPPPRSDLAVRAASGIVLALASVAILWAGGVLWALLVLAGVGIAAAEWGGMWRVPPSTRASLVAATVAAVLIAALGSPGVALGAAVLLAAGAAAARQRVLASGLLYVVIPGVALLWLRHHDGGLVHVLLVLLATIASDTGAYLAGRRFGGPKLAPRLSPKKTWSGAAGGLVAATLVGAVVGIVAPHRHFLGTALEAALLAIAAQAGDLAESAAKRRAGVKDSGQLIPGHGGVLDRVDGLMAAAPLAAVLVLLR